MTNDQIIQLLDPEVMKYHLLKEKVDSCQSVELKYECILSMFQAEIRIAELCLQLDFKELHNILK